MKVTVFGSARSRPDSEEYREAMRLGQGLAERGHELFSGGYGGLMEAASRGAREAGGRVIGITMEPWSQRLQPNQFLSEEHAANTLFARIEALIESDCLIALTGGAGTLGEVAIAWNLRQMDLMPDKLVILVGSRWRRLLEAFRQNLVIGEADIAMLTVVDSIEEALERVDAGASISATGAWRG